MIWNKSEVKYLNGKIVGLIVNDLLQINAKNILVLCSGDGSIAFEIAKAMDQKCSVSWSIIGMEADKHLLETSRNRLKSIFFRGNIKFIESPHDEIPYPDNTFHAVISEFIVYPSPKPTNISQDEMARVLKSKGLQLITDVIYTGKNFEKGNDVYKREGLEYYCEATIEDFIRWITNAGLKNIVIRDLTPIVKKVWEKRLSKQGKESSPLLMGEYAIGHSLFYIYFKAQKVNTF